MNVLELSSFQRPTKFYMRMCRTGKEVQQLFRNRLAKGKLDFVRCIDSEGNFYTGAIRSSEEASSAFSQVNLQSLTILPTAVQIYDELFGNLDVLTVMVKNLHEQFFNVDGSVDIKPYLVDYRTLEEVLLAILVKKKFGGKWCSSSQSWV